MDDKMLEMLSNQGWHVTKEGYEQVSENGARSDLRAIIQLLLDADIKDYGKPVLTTALSNSKISKVVLQIQKIKNISAPKSNQDSQAAPRMLKLILTDGHNHCQAIEYSNLPFLNHNQTAPGSKLLINNADINSGYIILDENSCVLLGGKVPSLYEKWEINRTVAKHTRTTFDGEGPPPWVSFGQKIQSSINNQSFKSLDNKPKAKENSEFDSQRQDAIAEASTGAVRKVFGGGVKQYSQIQNTQMREKKTQNYKEKINEKKAAKKELKNEEKLQKPPEKVSLFDFLETKLPPSEDLPIIQNVNNVEDTIKKTGSRHYINEKPKYNQPRNAYQNPQNQYQQYNYQQQPNINLNYQQNHGNNYTNTQTNYKQPNPQTNYKMPNPQTNYKQPNPQTNYKQPNPQTNYKYPNPQMNYKHPNPQTNYKQANPQYESNKARENKLWNEFQQMSISAPNMKNSNPENIQSLNKNLSERHTERASLNSEFASRSLKQYLNIKPNNQRTSHAPEPNNQPISNNHDNTSNQIIWKIGDHCMAKYWEDNKFYRATITALTDRTCVVQFNDYGNFEEILQTDCLPMKNTQDVNKSQSNTGSMEFRRGGNRLYNPNNKNYGKPRY